MIPFPDKKYSVIYACLFYTSGAGYGIIQDKIALLSEAMFRKYSEQDVLALDDWWWLITPYAGSANRARRVYTDGSLYSHGAYNGDDGVRPAFYVESGITLSMETDKVELSDSALLAEFTSKQLVEEVLRRIAEGQEDGDEDGSEIW